MGRAHKYDLEERTYLFAKNVRIFVKKLPRTLADVEDIKQVRASGSAGANYIEANESLSKKDFGMRIKICRKESKESGYWLRLIDTEGKAFLDREQSELIQESRERTNIFGAILQKTS